MKKTFRSLLNSEKKCFGTFVQLPCPEIVEILGYCGYDFVIIDNEHSSMTTSETVDLIRMCDMTGMAALVRVPDISETEIKKALDMGPSGLVVPNVNNPEDARRVLELARYAPLGKRGACPYVRANQYGSGPEDQYYAAANDDIAIYLNLESVEALEHLEEIIAMDGVDMVGIGIVDISVKIGAFGQMNHPILEKARQDSVALSRKYGKKSWYFATSTDAREQWLASGADFCICTADAIMLNDSFRRIKNHFLGD